MSTSKTYSAAAPATAADLTAASLASPFSVVKKRRVERRERLRKSALCKHFDKPGGCPFPNCKFAHGRVEVNDSDTHSVAAQRRLIRDQALRRAEEQYQTVDAGAVTSKRRGTMIERYYTELFSCDTMSKPMEDQYVHMHSNRLCVVGVAESHPVMQEELLSVEFAHNVLESRVTGKKKKGGCFMQPNAVICVLKCKSGSEFTLYSCIRGSLIEVNERLQKDPQLIKLKHLSDGYLAIIQPKKIEIAEIQESLLSKDEYKLFRVIPKANAIATNKLTRSTSNEALIDQQSENGLKNESTHNSVVEGPISKIVKDKPMSEAVVMEEER